MAAKNHGFWKQKTGTPDQAQKACKHLDASSNVCESA